MIGWENQSLYSIEVWPLNQRKSWVWYLTVFNEKVILNITDVSVFLRVLQLFAGILEIITL